jgi:hypothetical protein
MLLDAASGASATAVDPCELIPSPGNRNPDTKRLLELENEARGVWIAREPAIGVRIPSMPGRESIRVYSGTHRALSAQKLGLPTAYVIILELTKHCVEWELIQKNENFMLRHLES